MNCLEAEKYIYLFKSDELSDKEKEDLNIHLGKCVSCKQSFSELNIYKENIELWKKIKPEERNTNLLAKNILNKIIHEEKINTRHLNLPVIIKHPIFRIAGIITILLALTFYLNELKYINNSLAQLGDKYELRHEQVYFINSYRQCTEDAKKIITQLAKNDPELISHFKESVKSLQPGEVQQFATRICQHPVDLSTCDQKKKKQVIYNIINSTKRN